MKFTIRKKLLGGFLLVLSLLLATSIFAITKMNGIGAKTTEIDENWVPSLVLAGDLNGAVSDVQRLLLKFILESNQQEMNLIETSLVETKDEINELITQYEGYISSEEERSAYNQFVVNYNEYINSFPRIMEKARANAFVEANELQLESHSKWQEANDSIGKLIELNQNGAATATEESVQIFRTGVSFVTALTIIAIVLGVAIALVISRIISNPLLLLNKSAEQISSGDLTLDDIKVKNNDEIGELATSFNTMTKNLRSLIEEVGTTS
jgi:methyl-accepting chemotaxis protein